MAADMLSQEEINALLGGAGSADDSGSEADAGSGGSELTDEFLESLLTSQEKDVLGEVGNISMGTSATTLFSLLGERVIITTPYVEVIRVLPPNEIVKRTIIPAIEFIIFGPDIGSYNVGIDRDAQQLNEMVLDLVAQMLRDDSSLRVRIEGHANPYTINRSEHDELMTLSAIRANVVADQLRAKGVSEEQLAIIALGGTRNATSEWDIRNRNRRVELMIIQFDTN